MMAFMKESMKGSMQGGHAVGHLCRCELADDVGERRDEVDAVGVVQREAQRAVVHLQELRHATLVGEVLRAGVAELLHRLRRRRRHGRLGEALAHVGEHLR